MGAAAAVPALVIAGFTKVDDRFVNDDYPGGGPGEAPEAPDPVVEFNADQDVLGLRLRIGGKCYDTILEYEAARQELQNKGERNTHQWAASEIADLVDSPCGDNSASVAIETDNVLDAHRAQRQANRQITRYQDDTQQWKVDKAGHASKKLAWETTGDGSKSIWLRNYSGQIGIIAGAATAFRLGYNRMRIGHYFR